MAEALTGLHALTRWDSTSAFHWKGNSKAFALALKDPPYLNALNDLGEDITVSTSVERMLKTFASELQGVQNSSDIKMMHGMRRFAPKVQCQNCINCLLQRMLSAGI